MLDRAIQESWRRHRRSQDLRRRAKAGYDFNELYPCPSAYQAATTRTPTTSPARTATLTIENALVLSCNTVFYKFAAEMYAADGGLEPKGQPKEILTNTAKNFDSAARPVSTCPASRPAASWTASAR